MSFNETLKDLLIENNTNLKQVCKSLNTKNSSYYKYFENTRPQVDSAVKLANYFDCSLNYLMGIDDNKKEVSFNKKYNKNLFFERYVNLLKQNKLSHYKFSKIIGISQSTYYAYKNGSVPYMDILEKMARYFSCSIDYLVGRSDKL